MKTEKVPYGITARGEKVFVSIPVDDNGYVPEQALLDRFKTWTDERPPELYPKANRGWKDYTSRAEVVLPNRVTPKQAVNWWVDPGCCDIEDIDVAGKPKRNMRLFRNKKEREVQAKIPVVSTYGEEAKVRSSLSKSFTVDELDVLGKSKTKIDIYPRTHRAAGTYQSGPNRVTVDRYKVDKPDVVTHEVVHNLREKDKSRTGLLKSTEITNIEESLTVAEQQARLDEPGETGYYWHVRVYDEKKNRWRKPTNNEAYAMAREDHKLFTGNGKGLKGQAAQDSVRKNWEKSHISRLAYGSRGEMAINQAAKIYPGVEPLSAAKSKKGKSSGTGTFIPVVTPTGVLAYKPASAKRKSTAKKTKSTEAPKRSLLRSAPKKKTANASKKKR